MTVSCNFTLSLGENGEVSCSNSPYHPLQDLCFCLSPTYVPILFFSNISQGPHSYSTSESSSVHITTLWSATLFQTVFCWFDIITFFSVSIVPFPIITFIDFIYLVWLQVTWCRFQWLPNSPCIVQVIYLSSSSEVCKEKGNALSYNPGRLL